MLQRLAPVKDNSKRRKRPLRVCSRMSTCVRMRARLRGACMPVNARVRVMAGMQLRARMPACACVQVRAPMQVYTRTRVQQWANVHASACARVTR
mmetsp:Transcript_7082/g.15592  ORF Transcript_7082/g.15592 Transcript_7082/m.15592 type:complete len:95 (-) Transcript_7082:397-681(-)